MAKSKAPPASNRLRPTTVRPAAAASSGAVAARAEQHAPRKRWSFASIAQFGREVRTEARRITWPSRRETWITTVMVLLMVLIMGVFFAVVDIALSTGIQWVLKIPQLVSK